MLRKKLGARLRASMLQGGNAKGKGKGVMEGGPQRPCRRSGREDERGVVKEPLGFDVCCVCRASGGGGSSEYDGEPAGSHLKSRVGNVFLWKSFSIFLTLFLSLGGPSRKKARHILAQNPVYLDIYFSLRTRFL